MRSVIRNLFLSPPLSVFFYALHPILYRLFFFISPVPASFTFPGHNRLALFFFSLSPPFSFPLDSITTRHFPSAFPSRCFRSRGCRVLGSSFPQLSPPSSVVFFFFSRPRSFPDFFLGFDKVQRPIGFSFSDRFVFLFDGILEAVFEYPARDPPPLFFTRFSFPLSVLFCLLEPSF